jgi:hypothetical protein
VAVVTPAVYQAFAESGLGPRLKPPVERLRFPWRFQAARALLGRNLTAMLRPGSVQRLAAEGGTGVPLFGEDELHAFVSEANEEPPDRPRHGRWWEFWPTTEGSYAMFPGDDARRSSVATTLWIPAGRSAHVRRIDLSSLLLVRRRGSLLTAGGPRTTGPSQLTGPSSRPSRASSSPRRSSRVRRTSAAARTSDAPVAAARMWWCSPMMASIACWDATADRLRRRRDHHRGRRRRRLRPVEDARHPRAVLALIGVATYAVGIIRPLLVKRPRYWHAGETTRLSCIVRNRSFLNERTITALSLVDAPGWLKRTFWPFWKRGAQHPELIVWACPAWRRLASGTKGSLRQSFARATSRVPSTRSPFASAGPRGLAVEPQQTVEEGQPDGSLTPVTGKSSDSRRNKRPNPLFPN